MMGNRSLSGRAITPRNSETSTRRLVVPILFLTELYYIGRHSHPRSKIENSRASTTIRHGRKPIRIVGATSFIASADRHDDFIEASEMFGFGPKILWALLSLAYGPTLFSALFSLVTGNRYGNG